MLLIVNSTLEGSIIMPIVFGISVLTNLDRPAREQWGNAPTLKTIQQVDSGKFQNRGRDIDSANNLFADRARANACWPANDERRANSVEKDVHYRK
jgi:hypothetical protein